MQKWVHCAVLISFLLAGSESVEGADDVCVATFGNSRKFVSISFEEGELRDLKFHPAAQDELWVASANFSDARYNKILIIKNASIVPINLTYKNPKYLRDRTGYHYLEGVAAIAFSDDGKRFYTCQEAINTYNGMQTTYFMGPSVYEASSLPINTPVLEPHQDSIHTCAHIATPRLRQVKPCGTGYGHDRGADTPPSCATLLARGFCSCARTLSRVS
jgi:hypothetical protein